MAKIVTPTTVLATNKTATDSTKKLVHCSSLVNKTAVRREDVDGVEHIVVSSFTLPDNVVMNGILYPAEEINKSYKSLERTLAPVEHPTDADGNFISANDPTAIHNFHAGAFNVNVEKKNGRIHIEKYINVQEAMKSERGRRLLDRIEELETNENPRPIHTSTGVFLEINTLEEPQTNAFGHKYNSVASNMVFDHDAILLDSIGAAQPHQGVGMAVNAEGDTIEVEVVVQPETMEVETDESAPSLLDIREQLETNLRNVVGAEWLMVVDLTKDQCIFETNDGYYMVPYRVDGSTASIVGIPIRADRKTTYTPKVNENEGDAMRELMLKALADAGITVNADISDEALLAEYGKLQANRSEGDDDGATGDDIATVVANAVANAVKPVADELASLKSKIQANADNEKQRYVDIVANSEKYPGIDAETASLFSIEKLKELAANCGAGHGLPLTGNNDNNSGYKTTELPD